MTLEIKEGGFYKTRGGRKVGPMMANTVPQDEEWKWMAKGEKTGASWRTDGRHDYGPEHKDDLVEEWPDHIESPIRTVTRRIIEDGQSGAISWKGHADGSIWISVSIPGAIGQYVRVNKSELTNVGLIISQLAEFLDEDKGDE